MAVVDVDLNEIHDHAAELKSTTTAKSDESDDGNDPELAHEMIQVGQQPLGEESSASPHGGDEHSEVNDDSILGSVLEDVYQDVILGDCAKLCASQEENGDVDIAGSCSLICGPMPYPFVFLALLFNLIFVIFLVMIVEGVFVQLPLTGALMDLSGYSSNEAPPCFYGGGKTMHIVTYTFTQLWIGWSDFATTVYQQWTAIPSFLSNLVLPGIPRVWWSDVQSYYFDIDLSFTVYRAAVTAAGVFAHLLRDARGFLTAKPKLA